MGFVLVYLSVSAQDAGIFKPDSTKRSLRATPITRSLKVDGHLTETEWQLAPVTTRFIEIEPHQGEEADFQTEIRVLYNNQQLYFGIFCRDSLGKKAIRATDFKRDFSPRQHDLVALTFDGFGDQRNAMAIITNAYGVQRDFLAFDDLYYDLDWDGLWKVRTHRTDSGWYAEVAIPWQTLRYPRSKDSVQDWGFNMQRTRRLSNETSAFSRYPRSMTVNRMAYAGTLQNLQPPPPKPNLRIQPYILSSFDQFNGYPSTTKDRQQSVKAGGDLKWAINSNSVLDLTVNTDFAQADADRQVNNVTRFSVFFPERRQFFLENASLFGAGLAPFDDQSGGSMRIRPFFSRRIGLDDNGNPIPIDAGGRYVHRSAKNNYGVMAIRQREMNGTPATNFFVGRYSQNFGDQGRVGALITLRNRPDGTNIVSTIDGFVRLSETQSINTMVSHSTTTGVTGKDGIAGYAQYVYASNQWKVWWTQSIVTKNYDPSVGFVSRNDVIGTTPGVFWYYRGKKLPFRNLIRAFEPGIMTEFYHSATTGELLESQINMNPIWFNFQNGGFFGYLINPTYQKLMEAFIPLGVEFAPGTYRYTRHMFYLSSDPSRIVSINGSYEGGAYFDGRLQSFNVSMQFAPIPHVSLTGRFNRNHFKEAGIAKTEAKIDLYSIEARLALNPRIQLIGFYQLNSTNKLSNVNVRLSWEYQPLSFIYLVFNHRGFDNTQLKRQTDDHLIGKISYLRQL